MKKLFSILVLVAVTMTAVCLTSCGGDEPNNYRGAKVELYTNFDANFLKLFDITVTAKGFDGTTKTVNVTTAGKENTVLTTTSSANGTATVTVTTKLKSSITATGEEIAFSMPGIQINAYTLMSDNGTEKYYMGKDGTGIYAEDIFKQVTSGSWKLNEEQIQLLRNYYEGTKTYTFNLKSGDFEATTKN